MIFFYKSWVEIYYAEKQEIFFSDLLESLYIGMTRVKSHVIRVQNASKLGENDSQWLQNH